MVLAVLEGIENLQVRRTLARADLMVVSEVRTAMQLIEVVSQERPDIVVMDTGIDTMALEDLAHGLLADYPTCLILLTDQPNFEVRASLLGASACLERPYSGFDLLASLEQAHTRRRA